MQFDELDKQMRVFESINDQYVLPGIYMVARLDGRSFTRLTKEVHAFITPYDETFRDYMLQTGEHLMDCGFRIIYAFTHSDEISVLFHPEENAFNRKIRKYISILAGEASAKLSTLLGDFAIFDCRFPNSPPLNMFKITSYGGARMPGETRSTPNVIGLCEKPVKPQKMQGKS
jgi:tRNA(His) guanylyltransferase